MDKLKQGKQKAKSINLIQDKVLTYAPGEYKCKPLLPCNYYDYDFDCLERTKNTDNSQSWGKLSTVT